MLSMDKPMALNAHYSSSGSVVSVPAPGFAVNTSGASAQSRMASLPVLPPGPAPTTPVSEQINFFVTASSSYKSHFGDSATGTMTISSLPLRSAPGTPLQQGISGGCSGEVPSRISLSGSAGASASSSGFAGLPVPAPGNEVVCTCSALRSSSSSSSNGRQTAGVTPLVKFASPSSGCALVRSASTAAADGVAHDSDTVTLDNIATAPVPAEPTRVLRLSDSVDVQLQEVCSVASSSSTPSILTAHGRTNLPAQRGGNASCIGPSGTSPLLIEMEESRLSPRAAAAVSDALSPVDDAMREARQPTLTSLASNSATAGEDSSSLPSKLGGDGPSKSCDSVPLAKTSSRADHAVLSPKASPHQSKRRQQRSSDAPRRQHAKGCSCYTLTGPAAPDSLTKSGGSPMDGSEFVSVYDSDFETMLSIPASQVLHLPNPSLGVSRLVLCRKFTLENPESCAKGDMCRFVHADTRKASRFSIHVNYAWRSLELCTYPRLPAGDEITVLAPNERPPSEVLPSERILVTRGSTNWHEHPTPLSHCAHYYFNRMCNRGKRCNFIHAVHVDPNVQGDFKHAPAPRAVAPIAPRSSVSAASRAANGAKGAASEGSRSDACHGGAAWASSPAHQPRLPSSTPQSRASNTSNAGSGIAYAFAPNMFAPPPPGCAALPLLNSASSSQSPAGVVGGSPYVMLMNSTGQQVGCSYLPTTLMSPTPQQLSGSNGIFFILPTTTGTGGSMAGSGAPAGSSGGPAFPLGQSFSSLSVGPVNWSLYGDMDTTAWMPSSPLQRL
ncbi:hypothetical protein LSCM1_06776 [Leishmania martiniquensis]|uniref:C3H1-type domain-containing protein n=1 Tax=Leishmania martiniquensis TaxID=1580590 RepID=A0A836GTM0_9TRYP|nr:hypothetical protein LSCM1_06776 [Leishmania martiniquensis]